MTCDRCLDTKSIIIAVDNGVAHSIPCPACVSDREALRRATVGGTHTSETLHTLSELLCRAKQYRYEAIEISPDQLCEVLEEIERLKAMVMEWRGKCEKMHDEYLLVRPGENITIGRGE